MILFTLYVIGMLVTFAVWRLANKVFPKSPLSHCLAVGMLFQAVIAVIILIDHPVLIVIPVFLYLVPGIVHMVMERN